MADDEIDWRSVAVRITVKVDACCGCNCFDPLSEAESLALEKGLREAEVNERG